MGVCISHGTAAAYWCHASRVEADAKAAERLQRAELAEQGVWGEEPAPLPLAAACEALRGPRVKRCMSLQPSVKAADLRALAEAHELPLPLHIIVSDQGLRQKQDVVACHALRDSASFGPFYTMREGGNVVSPEVALVQLGRELDVVGWLLLAYEFCGTYTLDPSVPRGFKEREPLTSAAQVAEAAERLDGMKGIKTVRGGLRYLRDGSASPMETAIALMLSLPRRLGGAGIGGFEMNGSVVLGDAARKLYPRETCRCDLRFPAKQLALEYDSDAEHSTDAQKDSDALRRAALALEGIEVVSVRWEQVRTREGMAATLAQVAQKLRTAAPNVDGELFANLHARVTAKHSHPWD